MVELKLVSFATVVALWTLVTLLIKLIRMLLKWKCIDCKIMPILAAMLRKRRYFVKKVSSRSTRAGVFIWENFHLGYRDLGNRLASHISTSKFFEGNSGKARSWKRSHPG